jgi:hypoxanthine phosphoribosyltransferase
MALRTLISKDRIQARISEMGKEIARDFEGQELIVLCVLKGAVLFLADLIRAIPMDVAIDFIQVSSYGNQKESTGVVTLRKEPQMSMKDRPVLIVEDIIDSGMSIHEVHRYIRQIGAKSVKVATLLDKPAQRRVPFDADYVGFVIEPAFVVGYGLDFDEKYRNHPEVAILEE